MTTLSIEQLEKWYRKRLAKESKDFIKQAEKSYRVVKRVLKDVEVTSKELKDASAEDESDTQGISSRFALKISDVVENFWVDKEVTYANTEAMQEEIQRFIQDLWGAGARWIKRMDKKYKTTIKYLDAHMKELMREMKKIQKLLYEFNWIKDLERISSRIATLRDLMYGKETFEEQIRQVKLKITAATVEFEAAQKTFSDFTETSNVAEILNLDEEAERIASLLRMKLNILKKPVKKFLQSDTGVRIGPAGQKALIDYFTDPFTAIADEPDGTPGLLEGLRGMKAAIETGTLKMKDRLARRALEEIDAIQEGSIRKHQEKAKGIMEKRQAYAGSEVYEKSAKLAERLEEAKKNLEYHRNDLLRVGDEIRRHIEKVQDFKERIQTEIKDAFSEKVIIKIDDLGLEPLLAQCTVE